MKTLLTWVSTSLLIAAFLCPLWYLGIDREVPWLLTLAMAAGGVGGIWLLVRYRKSL